MKVQTENQKKSQEQDIKAVEKVLAGNSSAYDILQKKYRRLISSLIRRMIKDEEDVLDLTQETFIKAYNGLDKYQSAYSFSSWLFKIASNTCIDFLRKKRLSSVSLSQTFINDSGEETDEVELKDDSYVPDLNLLMQERKQTLLDAINSLPENYRLIIKMRHTEDLDYLEISEKLNMPLGTVKAHLFRARKILYNQLVNHRYLFTDD